jgi:hypothetical protein
MRKQQQSCWGKGEQKQAYAQEAAVRVQLEIATMNPHHTPAHAGVQHCF